MPWVKFHDKLCKGAKRGLPRAARFVFMELCLEARPGRGVLDLPLGMSDIDALHDVLGGNRKELADALKLLTAAPKATPDDPEPRAMVELTGESGARRLTIPSWETWNSGHEAPGASTERSRRYRQRQTPTTTNTAETPASAAGRNASNDDATPLQRPLHASRTVAQRDSNGDATQYRGEERRGEETREEISPPPAGERAPAHEDKPTPPTFSPSETPPSGPGVALADAESLLAAVGRHEMLRALHGDRRWATNASSGFMGGAVRAADVDAAVDAFVTREASRAPDLDDALDRFVRDRIGGYLTKAKQYGDEARARARREAERGQQTRPPLTRSPDVRAVLEIFGAAWAAKKRRAYISAAGDERHAADIAERARAAGHEGDWLDVVRWWSSQHLASQDRFVVDSDHALRTLASQLTAYGLPRRAAPPRERPSEPKAPAGEILPPPPGLAKSLGVGANDGAVVRRPGVTS